MGKLKLAFSKMTQSSRLFIFGMLLLTSSIFCKGGQKAAHKDPLADCLKQAPHHDSEEAVKTVIATQKDWVHACKVEFGKKGKKHCKKIEKIGKASVDDFKYLAKKLYKARKQHIDELKHAGHSTNIKHPKCLKKLALFTQAWFSKKVDKKCLATLGVRLKLIPGTYEKLAKKLVKQAKAAAAKKSSKSRILILKKKKDKKKLPATLVTNCKKLVIFMNRKAKKEAMKGSHHRRLHLANGQGILHNLVAELRNEVEH